MRRTILLGNIIQKTLEWSSPAMQFSPLNPAPPPLASQRTESLFSIWSRENRTSRQRVTNKDRRIASWLGIPKSHILASVSDGSVAVWDLNSRQAWCELGDRTYGTSRRGHFDPTVGLHLDGIGDDRSPSLKCDLGRVRVCPLTTFRDTRQDIENVLVPTMILCSRVER
jgi:hypothetical protein